MDLLRRINWTNTLFLILTPLVGVIGAIWLSVSGWVSWQIWAFAGAYMFVTGLCVTGGYHRLFAHRSYKASWPIRLFFLIFSTATFEGSVLEWSTDHRNHHLYTDTDRDPYNIKKGFWYAHIGWLFMLDTDKRDFSNVKDLMADPLVRFQHRFFVPLGILTGFVLPTIIAMLLWGSPLAGFIIAGALRIAVNHHLTFLINSLCHYMGKRTYSDKQSARDHWLTAIFTYGEGFHNFHHQFPLDYRNGVRAYHFDPTKWLIRTLAWFGLVSDLKRVSAHRIIRYRIRTEEQRLLNRSANLHESLLMQVKDAIRPVRERITHVLNRIEKLEKEYLELRALRKNRMRIITYRKRLKAAHQELKAYLDIWTQLVKEQRLQLPSKA